MQAIDVDILEKLGVTLAKRRDSWVTARAASGREKRWMENIDQYNGRDDATKHTAAMMDSVERGFPVIAGSKQVRMQRSTVFVNITRPKTNAAEARLANMLCPTDDRNWGLKPTPDPKLTQKAKAQAVALAQAQGQQGTPTAQPPAAAAPQPVAPQPGQPPMQGGASATAAPNGQQPANTQSSGGVAGLQAPYPDVDAAAQIAEAERCAKAMQDEIDDQLIACDFLSQERAMLHDVAVLGVGVLKGPIVVNRMHKAWMPQIGADGQTIHTLEITSDAEPSSERVDPWNIFPDPSCGEDVHTGRGIFEKKTYTSKQLRELAKQPGYLPIYISQVLEEGPQTAVSSNKRDAQNRIDAGNTELDKDHYELWEYWGEFDPEDLRSAGVDVPDGTTDTVSGCVVLVNKTVIKGYLNPIETGDLPYDVMVWERVDGEWDGYGVPFLMRSEQRVLNAAWRQIMDNAGLSVGPQVIIDPTVIQPADGRWSLSGGKIWNKVGSTIPVKDAFATVDIINNTEEIQTIIKLAQQFADDASSTPQLAQGEKGTAPDTVGGMTLLMNSSNVVLGRLVKQFDDSVTRPHIRRYYDWNMAYNDEASIKGDMQIDARGSSSLLVKDVMHQTMIGLGQYIANGTIAPYVNWENWFKEMLKIGRVDPTDIMKTDAQIAALSSQPPSATPEQIKANALLQVAQIRAVSVKEAADTRVQGEIAYAQMEQKTAQQDASANLQELQMKRDLAILQYDQANKISLQQTQTDLAGKAIQAQTQKELAAAELQMRANDADKDRQHQSALAIHDANTKQIENQASRAHEVLVKPANVK
jgi:hypothetical protein